MKKTLLLALLITSINSFALTAELFFHKGLVLIKAPKMAKENPVTTSKLKLTLGTTVRTGKNSIALIRLFDAQVTKTIKLTGDSSIVLKEISDKNNKTIIDLKAGALFVKYLKKIPGANRPLEIRTRSVAMGVRGTEFFATHTKVKNQAKDVWMCVNEGSVAVTNLKDKKSVLVKKGQGVRIKDGSDITAPKSYPWTQKLNWNMSPDQGKLENQINLESAYTDLLDQDYD